ncbi:MAG TPA: hypothetical protein VI756_17020 [Blastocatellia bacterium]
MSRNIDLSDELYERLKQQAACQGQTIEDYLDQLTAREVSEPDRNEREKARNQLLAQGLVVTWPGPKPQVTERSPITVIGEPLSQTIIEDRR